MKNYHADAKLPITNFYFQRYTTCMHTPPLSLPILFSLLSGLFFMPAFAMAGDDAMAPPKVITSVPATLGSVAEESESSPNLHDELGAPDEGAAVDIRSYQRKDGTTVTEYGAKGQVTHVKVQPPGGLPAYYLYLNAEGQFERRLSGGGKRVIPPSWIIKEF